MKVLFITTLFMTLTLAACSVNKRDERTPAPKIERVKTDFFFDFSPDRKTYKSRRFLFGESVEDKTGRYRNFGMDHYNTQGSANIEFDFNTEGDKLIGRLVNPTYPNNRDKWKIIVTFNINKSYYEENAVDPTGRTSNDRIERTDRSDPRARPFIDVDLSSMSVRGFRGIGIGAQIQSFTTVQVEDVEWSEDGNFLGFSATTVSKALSNEYQRLERINFLRIEPDDGSFEQTPYNKDNDRYTQMLYLQGERPNHFGEVLRATHWDINATTKKKHKIYLHNFPEEYLQVAKDSVEVWNDEFEKLVGYRPLISEVTDRKYAFDLRYHTIHWVDDIRLSAAGPLGLANTAADITNGKVLWTASIVWGGLIDQYAANYIPSFSLDGDGAIAMPPHNISHSLPENMRTWNQVSGSSLSAHQTYEDIFMSYLYGQLNEINGDLVDDMVDVRGLDIQQQLKDKLITQDEANTKLAEIRSEALNSLPMKNRNEFDQYMMSFQTANILNEVDLDQATAEIEFNPVTWNGIIDDLGLKQPADQGEVNLGLLDKNSEMYKRMPKELRDANIDVPTAFGSFSHDGDEVAVDVLNDLNSAITQMRNEGAPIDVFEVKKTAIRKTLVHEIGHTLGLAHNFKSNIMPEMGTVPKDIYEELHEKAMNGMTNKSSIMGYPDGRTVMLTKYEDMKPGHHDVARLHYLYKQEYPMYDKTTNGESDYQWIKLGIDGRIKDKMTLKGKTHTPGYLPGCNDTEASYYMDPYCNRHDRGYNAETLAQNYFERYEDALFRMLESNIDSLKGRNHRGLERYLWMRTSMTLSRTRLFYDYMRLKYSDKIKDLRSKNGDIFATYKNILNFSKNCRVLIGKSSDELSELSADENIAPFIGKRSDGAHKVNEFGDLCIATTKYFDNIAKYLEIEGKEYTEIDYFNRLVPGGLLSGDANRDYSQMFGSWKRMTLLPLKFNIMRSVLLPRALMSGRYGDYLLYPYGRPDTSFSTATLFPEEYLKVIRLLTESTMSIDDEDSEPRIAKSLLHLGYFLRLQGFTADYSIFPSEIIDAIMAQTQFRFSRAFIEVEATKEDGSDFAKSFKGSIYNQFNTSGKESLGNMYLYSLDRFIFKSQANSLALPMTSIRWRSPSRGYAFAIKLDYAPNINFEELEAFSPRNYFIDYYKNALEKCIKGDDDNGLSSYFKPTGEFEGIKIPLDIHERSSAYKELNDSIISNLSTFATTKKFDLNNCEDALRSQRALVLGASLMNGYFFPETNKYLEQGSN